MVKAWSSSCRGFHDGLGSNTKLVIFFLFCTPFYHHLFTILCFFLYIGFSDYFFKLLPHFLTFTVVSILKTFYFQILVLISESVIFVANILVIGILENFHIGAPLVKFQPQK